MTITTTSGPGQYAGAAQEEDFTTDPNCTPGGIGSRELAERLVSIEDKVEQASRRILQDVFTEGLAAYWERRAQTFEDARAKPGDYVPLHSRIDPAERGARDRDLAETALACRRKAQSIRAHGDSEAVYMVALAVLDPLAARDDGEAVA